MNTTTHIDYYNDIEFLLSELKAFCGVESSSTDDVIDITKAFA